MKPFKEGDKVLCINDSRMDYIHKGMVYTVKRLNSCGLVYLYEVRFLYAAQRFELISQYPTLRGGYGAV